MQFWKMQGAGNDFILIDRLPDDPAQAARTLCDRRFGIGADGMIAALPSDKADACMRFYNCDGSEAEMCGNGIRCLARYLYERKICPKTDMSIDTRCGVKYLHLDGENVTVDMGEPILEPEKIPVLSSVNEITLNVEGLPLHFYCVSMGNPHAVTFTDYPEREVFLRIGPALEHDPIFPAYANIEFARVNGDGSIDMRVWERGAGETLACGTGACATLVAGVMTGRCKREALLHLPGGDLFIRWGKDNHIRMTGRACLSFIGETQLV